MPKPNLTWTLVRMKDYARSHKLNHPAVKLSMNKEDLRAGLKKAGHWDYQFDTHGKPKGVTKGEFESARKGLAKKVAKKKEPKKPVALLRDYRRRHGGGGGAQKGIDREVVRRGGGGGKVPL